jgi:hypothetical protein
MSMDRSQYENKLRVNRFKKRKERRLARSSKNAAKHVVKGVSWDQAVCVLTGAITEAIWLEGGERDDAIATAEIVYHAICRDLLAWFDLAGRKKPRKILPFKRNKDYFKKKVSDG